MTNQPQHSSLFPGRRSLLRASILALVLVMTLVATPAAQAQTYRVLHNFTGGQDGSTPYSGITLDRGGNLYGTTIYGANQSCLGGCGTVFRISHTGVLTSLYRFHGDDGDAPEANVTIASDGTLYGTTEFGGANGTGNVYRLQPPARALANASGTWNETVIHTFGPYNDGQGVLPQWGSLIFDSAGSSMGPLGTAGLDTAALEVVASYISSRPPTGPGPTAPSTASPAGPTAPHSFPA